MYAWNLCGGSINWYKMFFIQTLPNMYAKPRTLYWKFRLNEKITLINVYVFTCQTGLQRERGGTDVGNNVLLPYLVVVPNRDKHPSLTTPQSPTLFGHPPWIFNRKQAIAILAQLAHHHTTRGPNPVVVLQVATMAVKQVYDEASQLIKGERERESSYQFADGSVFLGGIDLIQLDNCGGEDVVKDKKLQIVEYFGGDKLWVKHLAEFGFMLLLLVFLNAIRRFCACDVCLFWSESHKWAMACVAEVGHGWLSRTKITRPVSRCDIRKKNS